MAPQQYTQTLPPTHVPMGGQFQQPQMGFQQPLAGQMPPGMGVQQPLGPGMQQYPSNQPRYY